MKSRKLTLVQSIELTQISPVTHKLDVCVCLCNFITGVALSKHHDNQDIGLYHHYKIFLMLLLYSHTTAAAPPIPNHWHPPICSVSVIYYLTIVI